MQLKKNSENKRNKKRKMQKKKKVIFFTIYINNKNERGDEVFASRVF